VSVRSLFNAWHLFLNHIWRNLWSSVKKICKTASRPKNPQIIVQAHFKSLQTYQKQLPDFHLQGFNSSAENSTVNWGSEVDSDVTA
jgi:hypothetical protein